MVKDELLQAQKDKQQLQVEIDLKVMDLETLQLEIEALKDDKDELLAQMKMGSEVNENDVIHAMNEDELRTQNNKLRQALTSLSMNYEVDKSKLETKIQQLEPRAL